METTELLHDVPIPFDSRRNPHLYLGCVLGENIAKGETEAEDVVASWLSSPSHCANVMWPEFTKFGSGVFAGEETAWVMDLGDEDVESASVRVDFDS